MYGLKEAALADVVAEAMGALKARRGAWATSSEGRRWREADAKAREQGSAAHQKLVDWQRVGLGNFFETARQARAAGRRGARGRSRVSFLGSGLLRPRSPPAPPQMAVDMVGKSRDNLPGPTVKQARRHIHQPLATLSADALSAPPILSPFVPPSTSPVHSPR